MNPSDVLNRLTKDELLKLGDTLEMIADWIDEDTTHHEKLMEAAMVLWGLAHGE